MSSRSHQIDPPSGPSCEARPVVFCLELSDELLGEKTELRREKPKFPVFEKRARFEVFRELKKSAVASLGRAVVCEILRSGTNGLPVS